MLYARSIEDDKFSYFAYFLDKVLEGSTDYVSSITDVLENAHELALGHRNFYTINRNQFPIVVFLVKKDKEFFRNLDPNSPTSDDLKAIKSFITEQKPLTAIAD